MKSSVILKHRFVEFIPTDLDQETIYISLEFATASHKCVCGCGLKVVTPFSPTDWKLIFDGRSISLEPSIGNWSFPCQSHYWITRNEIQWAPKWSSEEIDTGRAQDYMEKQRYLENQDNKADKFLTNDVSVRKGFWRKLKDWFFGN